MKQFCLTFLFIPFFVLSQVNTEVHVFDINKTADGYQLLNGKNISNNKGYDSQPFFYDDNKILFASTRNRSTDILLFDIITGNKTFISNTKKGGEYSPQRIPKSKHISAVRLDDDGLQRFYKYNLKNGKSTELIADLKVAYPTWVKKNIVVASVIVNDSLHLIVSNLKKKKNTTVAKMVGRSLHKIPNTNLVSFISKENKDYWSLKSLNPENKEIKIITSLGKSEDVTWLSNGILLIAKDNSIYKYNPKKDKYPSLFFTFSDENINNITRIAVNKTGTKIALVAEVSPRYLAQEQLDAYNKRDIDAFLKPYAKNVKVYNYPNNLSYEGIDNMRKRYEGFFKNTPDLHCKLVDRIVFKDKVIDHELVTVNGRQFKAVAIYTMKNGKIVSVTFM